MQAIHIERPPWPDKEKHKNSKEVRRIDAKKSAVKKALPFFVFAPLVTQVNTKSAHNEKN
jgi:hypothetical protein